MIEAITPPFDMARERTVSRCITDNTPLSISVIVPVRNEAAFIGDTLHQLLNQDYDSAYFEIVVVDGESTDSTPELVGQIAEKHPNVSLVNNPKRLSSAARNLGIRHSRGDVVLIVDGHCEIPSRRMLKHVADAFITTGADCLGRPQPLEVEGGSTLQKAIAAARSSRLGHHPESFIYSSEPQFAPAKSVAVAYRREVFDKIGYFDEQFDAHEDGEFNYRCDAAGLRCYFTPDIAVNYFPRETLRGLFWQMVRYGRGRARFSQKHPGTWGIGALIPALFVLYVMLGGVLAAASPGYRSIHFAGLVIYAVLIAIVAIQIAIRERNIWFVLFLPAVLGVVHFGAGAGVFVGLLTGHRIRSKQQ